MLLVMLSEAGEESAAILTAQSKHPYPQITVPHRPAI
jgi:hypothetical protein